MRRRDFLKWATVCAAPLGCAGLPIVDARAREGVVLTTTRTIDDGVAHALEVLDTAWLAPGDSVLVKVACHSGNAHPAVTSPAAVRAVCGALLARGAGRVLVGDQGGVIHVRNADGARRSSTRALMRRNGLLDAIEQAGAEAALFDDADYDDGYVDARLPAGHSWGVTPRIARVVTEVDHVVYLPRLSSHCVAGYTHGHKLAVGFLRDDARHHMHFDAATISEKFTELNYCEELRARLRLVVTAVEKVLVDGGPDDGSVGVCEPAIVLASEHLANHDAVSVSLLAWAHDHLPRGGGTAGVPYGVLTPVTNTGFLAAVGPQTGIPWTSPFVGVPTAPLPHDYAAGVDADHALTRAYELLGGVPRTIEVTLLDDERAPAALVERLERARAAVA